MEELRQIALLRFYAGESPASICAALSITVQQLAEWERTTEPEQLRPAGLPYVSTTLSVPREGVPRSDLGLRVGPPDRPAKGAQRVHVLSGPTDVRCNRCGQAVIPKQFQPASPSWPVSVLIEVAPEGSGWQMITDEEADLFPRCEP